MHLARVNQVKTCKRNYSEDDMIKKKYCSCYIAQNTNSGDEHFELSHFFTDEFDVLVLC